MRRTAPCLLALLALAGCALDRATLFALQMQLGLTESRPRNWAEVRARAMRPPPATGRPAPTFAIPACDGTRTVTPDSHRAGKPLVLIFSSYT